MNMTGTKIAGVHGGRMALRGVQSREGEGLRGYLDVEMREKTVVKADRGHGTFEALQIPWCLGSWLLEG